MFDSLVSLLIEMQTFAFSQYSRVYTTIMWLQGSFVNHVIGYVNINNNRFV